MSAQLNILLFWFKVFVKIWIQKYGIPYLDISKQNEAVDVSLKGCTGSVSPVRYSSNEV